MDQDLQPFVTGQQIRNIFKKLGLSLNNKYRKMLIDVYESPDVHSFYRGLRESSTLGGKHKNHRQIIMFPNAIVYHFLDDIFKIKYGDNWLTDKDTLRKVIIREDLIKPWMVVKKI